MNTERRRAIGEINHVERSIALASLTFYSLPDEGDRRRGRDGRGAINIWNSVAKNKMPLKMSIVVNCNGSRRTNFQRMCQMRRGRGCRSTCSRPRWTCCSCSTRIRSYSRRRDSCWRSDRGQCKFGCRSYCKIYNDKLYVLKTSYDFGNSYPSSNFLWCPLCHLSFEIISASLACCSSFDCVSHLMPETGWSS